MSSWKEYKLEEVLDALIDYRGKTPTKTGFGIPLITAKVVKNGRLEQATEFIAVEDYESWMSRGLPKIGDIVLTTEAPLGEVAQLKDEKVALAQRIVTLRGKDKILQNDFLLYLLQSKNIQEQLEARSSGSTVKGIKQSELRKLTLKIPSFSEQEFISGQLKALDNKIQLNTQINQTLEQIAQAIFKSWFVDFDPVKAKINALANGGTNDDAERAAMQVISGKTNAELTQMQQTNPNAYKNLEKTAALFPSEMVESELGEVPKGWDRDIASNLFDISIGKTPPRKESEWFSTNNKDIPWLSIRDMGGNEIFSSLTSEYLTKEATDKFNIKIAPKNTVFLSFKLTVGRVSIASTEMCTNEAIAHFLQQEHSLSYFWLYCYLKSFNFESLGSTSSIATAVNSKTIKNLPIIYYDLLVREFHKKVTPIFNKILGLEQEIENLVKIRDALLLKLLSGDIYLGE
ncbi:restriction endonuclease subunit S [Pasteurella canis]|uniref:Type-1 restriction enzyme HindVIIP specificity protein n=1 Tax=Pasteurella canis TaxID=753 RepID=A0ABQ4VEI2_9PAST|nr:restriction endonuclease subunit S [Pasteurella canis]UEC22890.1 restriction endonuclease subunit S [Pasteurella canis]GJH42417.1 putative type-1 restriction enzyme HindVIIP specificity protein [Pasteurella canis]